MGGFSVIAVFSLLLLVVRGQLTTVPPSLITTGPVPTPPPVTTTVPVPTSTTSTSTAYHPPDLRVRVNLNLKLRAPSTINMNEVDSAIYMGAATLESLLQRYFNVKSLRIIDMESEDPSEIYY